MNGIDKEKAGMPIVNKEQEQSWSRDMDRPGPSAESDVFVLKNGRKCAGTRRLVCSSPSVIIELHCDWKQPNAIH